MIRAELGRDLRTDDLGGKDLLTNLRKDFITPNLFTLTRSY